MTLPIGWAETTIGEVTYIRNGKVKPSILGTMPFIGLEHIEAHTSRLLDTGIATDVRSAVARFERGDILYGRLRPYLNKVIEADFDGCASAEIIPFAPRDGICGPLIKRIMMSPEFLAFTASLDRGDRPRVSADEIATYSFPLPPLAEQRRIVAKLDALTARLSRARTELARVPILANHMREAALQRAFDGLLIDEGSEPKSSWSIVPFSDAGEIASNLVSPSTIANLPHIAPNHIQSGRPVLLQYRTIGEDEVISNKHRFYPGQIIYSKIRPNLRKVVLVDFEGGCSADMYPINAKCHPRYLLYWMLSPQFTWLATRQDGRTVLPKINQNALNAIPTPLAPLAVQERIAALLDHIFAHADRLEAEAERATHLLDRLEAAILAKAFRGELVPQDPNDEPATALLARIRQFRASTSKPKGRRRASV